MASLSGLLSILPAPTVRSARCGQGVLRGRLLWPAAAVDTCWRSGASATLDRLNKYFTFSEMPVVSSSYWNIKLEGSDGYGEEILRTLAENMAKLLDAAKT